MWLPFFREMHLCASQESFYHLHKDILRIRPFFSEQKEEKLARTKPIKLPAPRTNRARFPIVFGRSSVHAPKWQPSRVAILSVFWPPRDVFSTWSSRFRLGACHTLRCAFLAFLAGAARHTAAKCGSCQFWNENTVRNRQQNRFNLRTETIRDNRLTTGWGEGRCDPSSGRGPRGRKLNIFFPRSIGSSKNGKIRTDEKHMDDGRPNVAGTGQWSDLFLLLYPRFSLGVL